MQDVQRARHRIIHEIRQVLAKAAQDKSEPKERVVARLVHDLPRAANSRLAPIFKEHDLGLSVQGLWAGESLLVDPEAGPKVTPLGIRIGDLLLMVSLLRQTGEVDHTALLLQARPSSGESPPQSDPAQWPGLYSEWPEFTYVKAGPGLNGQRRRIGPPHLYNGAKYVFMRSGDCPWPPFFCHDTEARVRWNLACGNPFQLFSYTAFPSSPALTNFNCLVVELYDFILGNGGRGFRFQPLVDQTGWDQVVTDLVKATAALAAAHPERVRRWTGPPDGRPADGSDEVSAGLMGRALDEVGLARSMEEDGEWLSAKTFEETAYGGISTVEFVIVENRSGRISLPPGLRPGRGGDT